MFHSNCSSSDTYKVLQKLNMIDVRYTLAAIKGLFIRELSFLIPGTGVEEFLEGYEIF